MLNLCLTPINEQSGVAQNGRGGYNHAPFRCASSHLIQRDYRRVVCLSYSGLEKSIPLLTIDGGVVELINSAERRLSWSSLWYPGRTPTRWSHSAVRRSPTRHLMASNSSGEIWPGLLQFGCTCVKYPVGRRSLDHTGYQSVVLYASIGSITRVVLARTRIAR